MNRKNMIILIKGLGILLVISYFFYRSVWAIPVFSPYLIYYFKKKKREEKEKEDEVLRCQFKEAVMAVSASLNAGYSVENAFRESRKDLSLLYEKDAPIMLEFQQIIRGLDANERLEKLLYDFAGRCGLEEVESFAEIFATAKETGGDFSVIIRATAERIASCMEVKREIKTLVAAKEFEQKIMSLVPFLIMLYVELTSPGFFDPLYGNIAGIVIMTGCLGVYLLSDCISRHIINISI